MKIGELFIKLGFKADNDAIKQFRDGVNGLKKEMVAMSAAGAAAIYAINRALAAGVSSSLGLKAYTDYTGLATDEMEKFANVARMVNDNITLDNVVQAFQSVSDKLDDIKRKGEYPEGALWMGLGNLSNMRDPLDMIEKIYRDMPNIMARMGNNRTAFSKELASIGLGGLEGVFFLSPDKFNEFWRMATPTASQREAMLEISRAYARFGIEFNNFKMKMGEKIAPYWVEGLRQAVPIMDSATQSIISASKAVYNLIETISGGHVKEALIGIAVALLAVFKPFYLFVAYTVALFNQIKGLTESKGWMSDKIDEGLIALLKGMKSDETSLFGGLKRNLADKVYGVGVKSDAELNIRTNDGRPNNVNVSPVYNIQSTAEPNDLARELDQYNTGMLNQALDGIGVSASGARVGGQ